jgi:S1-C subfamily serine protease
MRLKPGTPVIALGQADGSQDSMKIGTLTSVKNKQSAIDAEYTVLVTDMMKNEGSNGVLINMSGQIVGFIQEQHLASNMEDVISAYAISDIKSLLEHLSNNQDIAYLGIKGLTVTNEALKSGVPSGVYVTEVQMDSPAMKGGIQPGDVLQAINGQKITQMSELTAVLERLSNRQNISLEGRRLTRDGYKKLNYQTSLSVLE